MRLGLDFGTSNTVGMVRRADGSVTPLLFDASPLLSSAVHIGPDATVLTGADAERAGIAYPEGLEPNPKRRIDDGTAGPVWLGEREVPVVDLIAAVLARQWAEAVRVGGTAPGSVVLTHPAAWGRPRLALLAEGARRAGLPAPAFVPEPVAAAAYFATILGREIPPGRSLVVYDLGAGTFDVSVVRPRTGAGEFGEVIATGGLADLGGLDLDAAVVAHARSMTATAAPAWARLDWPESTADLRARRELWTGARAAKEMLSRHVRADLHVPLAAVDLHLTREEFEKSARLPLERTVTTTLEVLRGAGVARETIAGMLLVGGSSRVPLVASLLHRRLGIAPTVLDQPELVVAHGSLLAGVPSPAVDPGVAPPAVIPAAPVPPVQIPPQRPIPAVNGIPPRGVVPPDFPVHLVEVTFGGRVGYTVRTYAIGEDERPTAVFASEGPRLPLFARPERATDYAVGAEQHAMTGVLHWETLRESMATAFLPLTPDHRYRLDLPSVSLDRDPREWLLDLVIHAGDLARELTDALEITEAYPLIGNGTLLDRLDDALRVARRTTFRRQGRRELRAFDRGRISLDWQRVAEVIESRVDWRDRPFAP